MMVRDEKKKKASQTDETRQAKKDTETPAIILSTSETNGEDKLMR